MTTAAEEFQYRAEQPEREHFQKRTWHLWMTFAVLSAVSAPVTHYLIAKSEKDEALRSREALAAEIDRRAEEIVALAEAEIQTSGPDRDPRTVERVREVAKDRAASFRSGAASIVMPEPTSPLTVATVWSVWTCLMLLSLAGTVRRRRKLLDAWDARRSPKPPTTAAGRESATSTPR
jgi:hypothetical protein